MTDHGFSLSMEKTKVAVLTKERVPKILSNQAREIMTLSELAVEYIGIMADTKMSFWEQIWNTGDKGIC